jgi:peptidase E
MSPKKAIYLLAGGRGHSRRGPDPLLQTVFAQSANPAPAVAYIGAASQDDKSFFRFIQSAFLQSGAGKVEQALIASARADIPRAKGVIQSSDIVFISGGDVELGMQILQKKRMLEFLSDEFASGKTFFGLSAGSIMLAREWVRWPDPENDRSAELFDCMSLAPVLCDTHAEEDDWEELKAALGLKNEGAFGFGIPTGSALKVNPDGQLEALGGPVKHYVNQDDATIFHGDLMPS